MINLPNTISLLRILMCPFLYFFAGDKIIFNTLYILVCLSDVLDGYIARKKGIVSEFGAKLDSLADFIFFIVLFMVFYIKYPLLLKDILLYLMGISSIRIFNLVFSYTKFKKIVTLHTILNKLTGLLLVLSFPFLDYSMSNIFIVLILIISFIASLEETLILILSKNINLDIKSIFCLKKK